MTGYTDYRNEYVENDGKDGGTKKRVKEVRKRSWIGGQGSFWTC